jgi:hypothetical protein
MTTTTPSTCRSRRWPITFAASTGHAAGRQHHGRSAQGRLHPLSGRAICYRDGRLRDCISLKAPVVVHGSEPTVASTASRARGPAPRPPRSILSHQVIGLHRDGYGRILGQCLWTSKRLYCRLMTLQDPRFALTLLQRLPGERSGVDANQVQRQRDALARFAATGHMRLRRTWTTTRGPGAVRRHRLGPGHPELLREREGP